MSIAVTSIPWDTAWFWALIAFVAMLVGALVITFYLGGGFSGADDSTFDKTQVDGSELLISKNNSAVLSVSQNKGGNSQRREEPNTKILTNS